MNSSSLNSILFVDDDEISNLFNKIFLGKIDINVDVDSVLNGREALDLLISTENHQTVLTPCLLLLDIKMPVMDGWEFLKEYEKQVSPEIRNKITIIMLTTSENEVDTVKASKNPNIKGYIEKPLCENHIKNLISKYFPNSIFNG